MRRWHSPDKPIDRVKNNKLLPVGMYSGKWNGYTITVDGEAFIQVQTNVLIQGADVKVRLVATEHEIEIYLK